jgi:hypothetical protein
MPYSLEVLATCRGRLAAEWMLPQEGNSIGDTRVVGDTSWVWIVTSGTSTPHGLIREFLVCRNEVKEYPAALQRAQSRIRRSDAGPCFTIQRAPAFLAEKIFSMASRI